MHESTAMKKPLAALASAALALGALMGTGVAAPPPTQAAYCGIQWGSLDKWTSEGEAWFSPHTVASVRAGRHACFDRFVVDLRGTAGWYNVGYRTVRDGTGRPVPLRGAADLNVFFTNRSVTKDGKLSWSPGNRGELVDVTDYRTFRQAALADYGSENGSARYGEQSWTSIGLGVRARLPFRVFVLDGPGSGQRLVVDVAHRW